jgi:hypothetical protein
MNERKKRKKKESSNREHSPVVLNIPINLLPLLSRALLEGNEDFFKIF